MKDFRRWKRFWAIATKASRTLVAPFERAAPARAPLRYAYTQNIVYSELTGSFPAAPGIGGISLTFTHEPVAVGHKTEITDYAIEAGTDLIYSHTISSPLRHGYVVNSVSGLPVRWYFSGVSITDDGAYFFSTRGPIDVKDDVHLGGLDRILYLSRSSPGVFATADVINHPGTWAVAREAVRLG